MSSDRSFTKIEDSDFPPMSRLFIMCDKSLNEDDIKRNFQKYGKIEDVWVIKTKGTGESKGLVYVKFTKTSDAALAQEEMDGQIICGIDRPIKVVVASRREEGAKREKNDNLDKYVRLFVVVSKDVTEDDLKDEFERYGPVESVQIVRDRITKEPKGFAYVRFRRFYHAAVAYEDCPIKYKAVFAQPKPAPSSTTPPAPKTENGERNGQPKNGCVVTFFDMKSSLNQPTRLNVICSSLVNQDQLWRLFDIIPGLDYCQIIGSCGQDTEATVMYSSKIAAEYAKQKVHGIEYPLGHRLIVKYADANAKINGIISTPVKSICNIDLPPLKPMLDSRTEPAKRLFITFSTPVSSEILQNVFCRFGNLISVYLLVGKNFGYANYGSEESACKAIASLNGAEIAGACTKVMEAEDRPKCRKRARIDD